MSGPTTIHPNFVSNQLLTSTQLNQLFDYLDEQDRLSRVNLTGSGIICGLSWQLTGAKKVVNLNEGYGLSSDGYLLSLDSDNYTHYMEYLDPDIDDPDAKVSSPLYTPWKKTGSLKGQVEGILLLETEATESNKALTADLIEEKILVLYLEKKAVDLTSCLVTDCDNKGSNIHYTVRVLLVPESLLSPVAECPDAPVQLNVPRLHTRLDLSGVNLPEEINQAYYELGAGLKTPLLEGISMALDRYGIFVGLEKNWSWLDKLNDWYDQVNDGSEVNQYFYEITKILVKAYNELIEAACRLLTDCDSELNFPRHLMLGHLEGKTGYRNEFIPSPVQNVNKGDLKAVALLFDRIRLLIQQLPAHETLLKKVSGDIKLIPSHNESSSLGLSAVPWYYTIIKSSNKFWQPADCCTTAPLWRYTDGAAIDLDYNKASLLRIDGHLGLPCEDVVSQLESLKIKHNAEFCVLPLSLSDNVNKELKTLNDQLVDSENLRLELLHEYRLKLNEFMKDGTFSEDEVKEITAIRGSLKQYNSEQYELLKSWSDLRCASSLLCEPVNLQADYRNLRCYLSGLINEVKSALLSLPVTDKSKIGETIDKLASGSGYSDYVQLRLLDLLENIDNLLGYLPHQLCAFNYEVFHSYYQSVISDLIEYQYILPLITAVESSFYKKVIVEAIIDLTSRILAEFNKNIQKQILVYQDFIQSRQHTCLATVYYHYEQVRRLNGRWFKQFAKSHPGLESTFSVSKGGSIILVCDDDNNVVADFSLSNCISCCCDEPREQICLPPVASPDYVSVTLVEDKKPERRSYQAVSLNIDILNNDYSQLDVDKSSLFVELKAESSELGGNLELKEDRINYTFEKPLPGLVDRFSYILKDKACESMDTGHALIYFAPPPVVEPEIGEITGATFLRDGDYFGPIYKATIKIIETGQTTVSGVSEGIKGYFKFLNLPYATYTLVASHADGFESSPVTVTVNGSNTPVNIELSKKAILDIVPGEWVGTVTVDDRWLVAVSESSGTDAAEAKEKLINVLSEKRSAQLATVIKAEASDAVRDNSAFESATNFIRNTITTPAIDSASMSAEYREVIAQLMKAIKSATAEDQPVYHDLIKS
ncbi:MAG: carboxypeptidase-like regulatory domain-containing protein, partial [Gammaproteobacteria bacterium]|nr:carboxypeptidase-like regulatory domain-containing protein [Gammaproteobacteria bacterium]